MLRRRLSLTGSLTKEELVDEDTQAPAENIGAVEDNSVDTSPVDETTTSAEQETVDDSEQTQVNESDVEETTDQPERKPSRAERRIRDLKAEVQQLKAQPNQLDPNQPAPPQLDIQAGEELSVEDYQKHVAQAAQGVVAPQLDQLRAEFETKEASRNFDSDTEFIEKQYEELSEDSPLREVLEEEIANEFKQKAFRLVGFDQTTGEPQYRVDPSVRLADIAKQKVEIARKIAERSSADIKNSVAKQADESSLRPGVSQKTERPFSELSIEEMEAKLGTHKQ
jgi:hypothetical protein